MTEPGSGSMQVGPNGLESLSLVSPSGDLEFQFSREPSGAEHYARRSDEELEVKKGQPAGGPGGPSSADPPNPNVHVIARRSQVRALPGPRERLRRSLGVASQLLLHR